MFHEFNDDTPRLTRIRLRLAIYFLRSEGKPIKSLHGRELCRIIRHLGSGIISDRNRTRTMCPNVFAGTRNSINVAGNIGKSLATTLAKPVGLVTAFQ